MVERDTSRADGVDGGGMVFGIEVCKAFVGGVFPAFYLDGNEFGPPLEDVVDLEAVLVPVVEIVGPGAGVVEKVGADG